MRAFKHIAVGVALCAVLAVPAIAQPSYSTFGPGPAPGGVTSITGTANQIAASASTGAVTLSTPSDFRLPGTINLLTLTQPATAATLTIANNKTFTVSNTLALAGTDSTVMTFPTTSATIARTDAGQTFTGTNAFGILTGTSIALGGATIGTDALGVTGNVTVTGSFTIGGGAMTNFASSGALNMGANNINQVGTFRFGSSNDVALTRAAAATLQFGPADVDTAPVAQTLRTQGALAGGTSNVAGADWTFIASPGKGAGAGGSLIFQTAPAGSTGTAVNAPVTALTITSTKAATFAGGVTVVGQLVAQSQTNGNASSWRLSASAASSTVPTLIPNQADATTGIGAQASGDLSVIVVGAENTRFSTNLVTLLGSVQLNVAAMTQTSAAQSGTACYNSGTGAVTYDATLGCLASLPELKDFHGNIVNASAALTKITPMWASWKVTSPEWKGGDHEIQPVFNAREVAAVDKRLVSYGPDGKLRGVRYMEMTAYLWAVDKELLAANDNLARRIAALEHNTHKATFLDGHPKNSQGPVWIPVQASK